MIWSSAHQYHIIRYYLYYIKYVVRRNIILQLGVESPVIVGFTIQQAVALLRRY